MSSGLHSCLSRSTELRLYRHRYPSRLRLDKFQYLWKKPVEIPAIPTLSILLSHQNQELAREVALVHGLMDKLPALPNFRSRKSRCVKRVTLCHYTPLHLRVCPSPPNPLIGPASEAVPLLYLQHHRPIFQDFLSHWIRTTIGAKLLRYLQYQLPIFPVTGRASASLTTIRRLVFR